MNRYTTLAIALCLVAVSSLVRAEASAPTLKLPAIFSDHMVLQRELPVPVWGWAAPGEEVTAAFAGQTVSATAGADGKWKLSLKPLQAADSLELAVKGKEKTITVKDVAVGEVWVAAGQSNMCIPINRNADDLQRILPFADDPGLRMCPVVGAVSYTLLDDVTAQWIPSASTPKVINTYGFSAVGYTFASHLRRTLKVPVGIFVTAAGGVPGVTYISPEGMEASKDSGLLKCAAKYRKESAIVAKWKAEVEPAAMAKYLVDKAEAKKNNTALPKFPTPDVVLPWSANKTSMLYHGQLGPLQPYAIRGALWYQGESGDGPTDYRALLDALLADWRKGWDNPELALLVVQITAQSPDFREKQLQFWQATPHTGLAVINDTCTANEYVHVKYKETAGRRLSLLARAIVYGEQVECSGPVYQSVKFDGAKATLTFTHVGDGLAAKVPVDPEALTLTAADLGGDLTAKGGELRGFTIAGADKKFVPARAEIQGDTVVVSSEQIANPVAVRYLWCRWPALWTDTTLYNKNGLPAPPFRTDDVATPVTVAVPGVPRTIIPKMMPGAPRHAELVKLAQAGGVDVMFLGDSITEFWRRAGKAVWAANFAPLEAANFGVAGEGTQSVLWRLQNGELEGIHPKVVVLLIGTNNTNEKPADIALGVKAVIAEIQQRSPGTRVLLMGIFPRDGQPGAPSRAKIAQANAILATYAHADDPAQVVYMDIGARFLNADGTMNKDLMPDTLHPSEQGYQVWADAILDTVKRLR